MLPPGTSASFKAETSAKTWNGAVSLGPAGQAKKPVAPSLEKPSDASCPFTGVDERVNPSWAEPGGMLAEWA